MNKKIFVLLLGLSLIGAACDPFGSGGTVRVGIVKTANGGVDWQSANVIEGTNQQSLNRSISKLKYQRDNRVLYASSYEGGLFKTDDAAENWQEVLGQVPVYDFAFSPNDHQIIYAAGYLNDRGRLFKTLDGGQSWNDVYVDAGEENPVRAIAVNPTNSEQVIIGLGKGLVILSENAGQTWRQVANYNGRVNQIFWQDYGLYVVVKERGVFRSTDGALSFEEISQNIDRDDNRQGLSLFGTSISDYRQIGLTENGQTIYLTANNGLYRTTDGGQSWNYVSMPYRQTDAAPHAVSIAPNDSSILYVSSGSVVFRSNDSGFAWAISDTQTSGLITSFAIDPNLNTLVFAGVSR